MIYIIQLAQLTLFNYESLGLLAVCYAVAKLRLCEIELSSPLLNWLHSQVNDL
jgi:hypothetical protein